MPRISVKGADKLRHSHPREFSLLYEFGGTADSIDAGVRFRLRTKQTAMTGWWRLACADTAVVLSVAGFG
jgi:hypothetical protein